jgi:imidazoleglycerol phosphate synthase glutamine amidotransferase subunit HisH
MGQALLSVCEEGGEHRFLIIEGAGATACRTEVPHMSWNQVRQVQRHPIFNGIEDSAYFYFVLAYLASQRDVVISETDYSVSFASVLARENLIVTQFHPEGVLRRFVNLALAFGDVPRPVLERDSLSNWGLDAALRRRMTIG